MIILASVLEGLPVIVMMGSIGCKSLTTEHPIVVDESSSFSDPLVEWNI